MGGRNGLSLRPSGFFRGSPREGADGSAWPGGRAEGPPGGARSEGRAGETKTRARASYQEPRREARNAPHPKGEPGSVVRGRPPYPEAAFQRAAGAWRPEESWFPPLGIP